jgi:hypothetical protein
MSRQRSDPAEVPSQPLGPLFAAKDPPSSIRAAATAVRTGTVTLDEQLLVTLIGNHPGSTMEELGAFAARLHGGSAFEWRIRLGRRTGPLKREGAIHAVDDRETGLGRWRLGAGPDALDQAVRG